MDSTPASIAILTQLLSVLKSLLVNDLFNLYNTNTKGAMINKIQ